MRQGRRSRRFLLGFVAVPALVALALLAAAAWGYHLKTANDTAIARYGVTTTGVISSTSVAGLGISYYGGATQYDKYAIVDFTARGTPETARVFLTSCTGLCTPNYQSGEKLLITYDSRNTDDAVIGRYHRPFTPADSAVILVAGLGLIVLFAAAANLVLGA